MQDEQNETAPDSSEQAAQPQTETRLTRKRVADQLGVSIFKVRSMEGNELHPKVVGGVHYFDPEEVAALAWSVGAVAPRCSRPTGRGQNRGAGLPRLR
jgi:hypothetical protein